MTQLTDKHWAVQVPDDVSDFKSFVKSVKNDEADIDVGKIQFLVTTKTATEEDARKVVRNYGGKNPLLALRFFLRSKGLDPDKNNYALIEKEDTNADKLL